MARNRALQYQNRMRKLADACTSASLERMSIRANLVEAQKRVKDLETEFSVNWVRVTRLETVRTNILKGTYGSDSMGLFEWGLPEGVTREEWSELTGEDLSAGGNP